MTSVSGDAKQRASDKLVRLAGQGLDLVSFWRASTESWRVPSPTTGRRAGSPWIRPHCWSPATSTRASPSCRPQWLIHEYYQDDVNKLADVARSQRGISTLHEATGGDPSSSPRWHFNMTLGGDQELIAALRSSSGEVWGGARAVPRARPGAADRRPPDQPGEVAVSRVLSQARTWVVLHGAPSSPAMPSASP